MNYQKQKEEQKDLGLRGCKVCNKDIIDLCDLVFQTPEHLVEALHLTMEEVVEVLWEKYRDDILDILSEVQDDLLKNIQEDLDDYN